MKCLACKKQKCRGKFRNRHLCLIDECDCDCVCQITVTEELLEKGIPVGVGVAFFGAGISTFALFAPAGGLFLSLGSVLMTEVALKALKRERVNFDDLETINIAERIVKLIPITDWTQLVKSSTT